MQCSGPDGGVVTGKNVPTERTMLYVGSLDAYLTQLKTLVRKGRIHPVLGERTRLAGHLRENLKTLGLKRVAKDVPDLARELARVSQNEGDKGEGRQNHLGG